MTTTLKMGWAEIDITPNETVLIAGQFYARVSEGVLSPLTATAWAIETDDREQAVFVSCDLCVISDGLLEAVRMRIKTRLLELDPSKVILHATHTHTAPQTRIPSATAADPFEEGIGIELDELDTEIMSATAYIHFAADQIVQAIKQAWEQREPSGYGYGQGFAVIGRNRRWVDLEGTSMMYNLNETVSDRFRHIEGYEDHSVNIVATYDLNEKLTGLIINVACPSQEGEHQFLLSADFWHETREELRRRFGSHLFVLPQCSAAGDLTSHVMYEKAAHARMLELSGRTAMEEIAERISSGVEEVLPYINRSIHMMAILKHQVDTVELTANRLTESDAQKAIKEAELFRIQYEREKEELAANPNRRQDPRWYKNVTTLFRKMHWHLNVAKRYEMQKSNPTVTAEVHTIRLGDIAFATNPFEYYLDYGIQIKVRSAAIQTFLVQLAGNGTYVPSPRSVSGGGYGSVPASNPIGSEGGQQLAEYTVDSIRTLWEEAE